MPLYTLFLSENVAVKKVQQKKICRERFFLRLIEVEEVPMNIYCISSATENIIMKVPQKIPIHTFSV